MDERIPTAQGSCTGNIGDEDWVNPDDDGNDGDDGNNGGDDGDDGNNSGDDGNDGDNGGDDGDDGNDGGDDGNSNEVVEALIREAKQAASDAENILEDAQSTLTSIRTK